EELRALEVIEVGQTVEGELFGLSEDRQPFAAVGAHGHPGCEEAPKFLVQFALVNGKWYPRSSVGVRRRWMVLPLGPGWMESVVGRPNSAVGDFVPCRWPSPLMERTPR